MIDLEIVLEKSKKMPTMPAVVVKLAVLVSSPDSNITDIVKVISYDQSLTANLLQWSPTSRDCRYALIPHWSTTRLPH